MHIQCSYMLSSKPEVIMAECLDIEVIITEVMEKHGVKPENIADEPPFELSQFMKTLRKRRNWSKRYFCGQAKGHFKCDNDSCNNCWTSYQARCILDLKKKRILLKFKQKCKKKDKTLSKKDEQFTGVEPRFMDKKSLWHMVEWAVKLHCHLRDNEPKEKMSSDRHTLMHRRDLCEFCQLLGKRCTR